MTLIRASHLYRSFGREQIVRDLSLSLYQGEITLLLGANGSGKSTLLKLFASLLRCQSGTIEHEGEHRGCRIGYFGHDSMLYRTLSVEENLRFYATLSRIKMDPESRIERWGLTPHRSTAVENLSKGTRARVALCRVFMNEPQLILLDEPTSQLDNKRITLLLDELGARREQAAVLIATHDLHHLRALADRVVVLADGGIARDSRATDNTGGAIDDVIEYYKDINR